MQFDWNTANVEHVARHSVTPEEAEQVIENNPIDIGLEIRKGESRFLHLGKTNTGRVLFVVVTERNGVYRVVTARPATRKERAFYSSQKAKTDDQNYENS
jgi:uncharacterized DUF497 family protein